MLTEAVYRAVRDRELREPDVVGPVLLLLADPDSEGAVTSDMQRLAAEVAVGRESAALDRFVANALPTSAVLERVSTWNDRRTVASARRRGQLLGLRVGREAYHPGWQFTPTGLQHELPSVIRGLLDAAAGDPLHADLIMRIRRPAMAGRSLAELLATNQTLEVLTWLRGYRDGYIE